MPINFADSLQPTGPFDLVDQAHIGGTTTRQAPTINAAGNTTVTVTGAMNTVIANVAAGGGAYTHRLVLPNTGAKTGAMVGVFLGLPASTNPTLEVRNLTTGGTLLFSAQGRAQAGVATLFFAFNGTNWEASPGNLVAFDTVS